MKSLIALCVAALLAGCGDTLEGPASTGTPGRPRDLKALSVNSTTVALQWSAPSGSDTTLSGYVVSWGVTPDTVSRTVTQYSVSGLGPGLLSFSVLSLGNAGTAGAPVSILWAPASRFDSAYTIGEFSVSDPSRHVGMDVGTQNSDPATLAIDPSAQTALDFFLYGEGGQALTLRAANLYLQGWNATLFSPEYHQGPGLDLYLPAFPSGYTHSEVPVMDNTVYYARVFGNQGAVHYVRIHVRITSGTFPTRSVAIRLSLQRLPGVLAA
jgi:hypothetical protein